MKILVIEDDEMADPDVTGGLREAGHVVDLLTNGQEGLIQAAAGAYDVQIVDRMLPGIDGVSRVKTLRGARNRTPILFLAALGGGDDRIEGLNGGADDYIVKPFAFGEPSPRIAALGRRPQMAAAPASLRAQDLELDLLAGKVTRGGKTLDLLPREFALLEHLMRRKGKVQTRTMLLEALWEIHFHPQTNVIETHVNRLRGKVDKPFDSELIETVRGAGYRIVAE